MKPKKIQSALIIYWVLLAYIIAALIWWFIALGRQNESMSRYKLDELEKNDTNFAEKEKKILKDKSKKTAQYIGEGGTFLLLILAGATFVFRAVRRELKSSAEQQNFMMAITHELKTPIAVTKLNLETLQKHKLAEAQQHRLISNTLQETNRLDTLCNNLLISSQIEGGGYKANFEEQDFSLLVSQCVNEFVIRYPNRQIIEKVDKDVFVNGDFFLLQIAVNNLIENAIKYSPKGSDVNVWVSKNDGQAILKVIDAGVGISSEDKEKIFQKFYRAGNEATKRAKGTGLGLYLTSRICKEHKGNLKIEENVTVGSIFTLSLKAET